MVEFPSSVIGMDTKSFLRLISSVTLRYKLILDEERFDIFVCIIKLIRYFFVMLPIDSLIVVADKSKGILRTV